MAAPLRSRLLSAVGERSRDKLVSKKLVLREMINAHAKAIPRLELHVAGQMLAQGARNPRRFKVFIKFTGPILTATLFYTCTAYGSTNRVYIEFLSHAELIIPSDEYSSGLRQPQSSTVK